MVDMTNDVIRFEEMFADRFTEKDKEFMDLKSKSLPNPVVIYPWKTQRKQWNKRWDYGNRRNQDDRSQREGDSYRGDKRHGQNSYNRYEDRSRDGENSRYRDRSQEGRDRYRDRSQEGRDRYRDRSQGDNYRDRSHSDKHRDRSQSDSNKPFDFQAALKAYQER